ncbi:MAG: thiol reductant ABC exporter subunit CydC, partial [Salinisphaera sp.]|uniref:thiol reductant ABC exporter subunit CydC n=1 Tax=Salinisphaera sp. TaxID=1914330 RepID=UPI003C7A4604
MSDLRWWLQLARPYRGAFALGIVLGIITVASNMALLAVSGWFIASMAVAGLAAADMNYFTPAAAIRGLAIARTGGRYLERLVTHDATLKLLTGLRVWFYRQVEPLSAHQLSGLRGGDLLARVRADIDTLSAVYLQLILPVIVGVVCVAGAVCVWAWYSEAVALANLTLLIAAGGLLPWWVARAGRAPGAASVAVAARLKTQLVDMVEGLGELVVFGAFAERERQLAELTEAHLDQQARLSRLTGLGQAGMLVLINAAVLASIGLIVPAIRSGALAPVDFAPVVLLVLASVEAVAQMPGAWQALGQLQAATRRLRAFETLRPAIIEPESPRPAPVDHRLVFAHVFARHAPDGPWALADVSLAIAPGERVAIVGASGAGKSSLVHLLTRMTVPERGAVCWGDVPVTAYRSDDLRAAIALVPQRIYLFHASVTDNIAVGDPEADANAIIAAAKAAAIHDEIMALPEGYDTLVGEEGLRLSGGQIRRIGIARALLRDAPVVIMDEPGEGL